MKRKKSRGEIIDDRVARIKTREDAFKAFVESPARFEVEAILQAEGVECTDKQFKYYVARTLGSNQTEAARFAEVSLDTSLKIERGLFPPQGKKLVADYVMSRLSISAPKAIKKIEALIEAKEDVYNKEGKKVGEKPHLWVQLAASKDTLDRQGMKAADKKDIRVQTVPKIVDTVE